MIKELTLHDFETETKQELPVVVEFYTPACAHCKKLAGALEKLSDELQGKAVFAKVNIAEETALQAQYDISSVPTLLFLKNGQEKNKLIGEVHPLIIQEEIRKLG